MHFSYIKPSPIKKIVSVTSEMCERNSNYTAAVLRCDDKTGHFSI